MLAPAEPGVICYSSGHVHSETISKAFAQGSGALVVGRERPLSRLPGFVYGTLRGGKELMDRFREHNIPFLFADNGYFGRGHYDGYYKVTWNAYQCSGRGRDHVVRWRAQAKALGLEIKPWRRDGDHVLICPPIPEYGAVLGMDVSRWLSDMMLTLSRVTDRPLRVRYKPGDPRRLPASASLADDLDRAHALVTHDSNVVVEAIMAGVPAFVSPDAAMKSPAAALGNTDLASIEDPELCDHREEWFGDLAENQWTLDEMRDGTCWRTLRIGPRSP